jgi:hypothetical protein
MDIRYRAIRTRENTQPDLPISSFHAAARRAGDMIVEEFEDGEPSSQPDLPMSSFHAAVLLAGDMIIEEFGDGEPFSQQETPNDLQIHPTRQASNFTSPGLLQDRPVTSQR